jgi:hypothetical protein
MASLPNLGAPAVSALTDEQLSLLISMSSSIATPPQCTMNDIQAILHKISASLAQCRMSLALACARAASDVDASQVFCYQSCHNRILKSHRINYQDPIIIVVPNVVTLTLSQQACTFFSSHQIARSMFALRMTFLAACHPCRHIQVLVSSRGVWQRICQA